MAIKMKFLHYPEKGKIATFTKILAEEYGFQADKIPPAYEPTRERILFMGITSGKTLNDTLARFLRGLSKEKAQNVAVYTDASDEAIDAITKIINETGIKLLDVKKVKGSAIPFLTGVKAAEADDIKAWAKDLIEKVQG